MNKLRMNLVIATIEKTLFRNITRIVIILQNFFTKGVLQIYLYIRGWKFRFIRWIYVYHIFGLLCWSVTLRVKSVE